MLLLNEEGTQALEVEGPLSVSFENKGLADVTQHFLVHSATRGINPYTRLKIDVNDVAAYICTWKIKPQDVYSLEQCRKRLLVEPVRSVFYERKDTGLLEGDENEGIRLASLELRIAKHTLTLTYLDFSFLVSAWQHHVAHMSRDYYPKVAQHYRSSMPYSQTSGLAGNVYSGTAAKGATTTELLQQFVKATSFWLDQHELLERLRQ